MEIKNTDGITILEKLNIKETIQYMIDHNISLNQADFSQKKINAMTFKDIPLNYIDFSETIFRYCTFINVNINAVNFSKAAFYSCEFVGTEFHHGNFKDTKFSNNKFFDCYQNIILTDSILQFNDYYLCNLSNTVFPENVSNRFFNCSFLEQPPYIPLSCPSDGSFIGWKVVDNCLIKLLIPEDARRSSANNTKCRCDKAKVLSIINLETGKSCEEVLNSHYNLTIYKVGNIVLPDRFNEDKNKECAEGIHFFINKQDAINYYTLYNR